MKLNNKTGETVSNQLFISKHLFIPFFVYDDILDNEMGGQICTKYSIGKLVTIFFLFFLRKIEPNKC